MRGADNLTERERVILRLVADGLSNRDIAAHLSLSVNTVKWYTGQIYQKLGVQRRTQAVAILGRWDEAVPPVRARHLPAPLTPLVGRERELSEILSLLQPPSATRLLTIVGVGGIGKTRLAQAVATAWRDEQPEAVCWVALEGLASPDQIVPAIGAAIGFQFGDRADPRRQLLAGLRRRSLLLVLDSLEHLLDAAPLVSDLLAAAPGLIVLATSRERLNLRGETVYRLGGLAYPEQPGAIQNFSAVYLFLDAARRVQHDFDPTVEDVLHVGRMCQMVEGMPLAIHIAAAWIDVLAPARIAAELERGLDILSARTRDVPDRHRSMQVVFEHSWSLLQPAEQAAFSKLAAFRGGFDRAAAEAVAGASLFLLSTLVDKSLVMRVGPDRYKLHELLRQFAEEKLRADPEEYMKTLDRHCHHYGTLLQEFEQGFNTQASSIVPGLIRLRPDYDNILAGWQRAVEQPLIAEIGPYVLGTALLFVERGLFVTGEQMMLGALEQMGAYPGQVSAVDRMRVLAMGGLFSNGISNFDRGRELLEQALELSEASPAAREADPELVGVLLNFLSWNALLTNDIMRGRALAKRSLALSQDIHFEFGIWQAQVTLGDIEFVEQNFQTARQMHYESLQIARRNGDISGILCSLSVMACDCSALGDEAQARDLMRQLLIMSRAFWIADAICVIIVGLALLHQHRGEIDSALDVLAILYHHPQCGGVSRYRIEHLLPHYRARLSPAQVEAALSSAAHGQLSTPLLESSFVIDAALIDRLLAALDKLPQG